MTKNENVRNVKFWISFSYTSTNQKYFPIFSHDIATSTGQKTESNP